MPCLPPFINQVAVNLSIQNFRKERHFVHSRDGIIGLHFEAARRQLQAVIRELATGRDREILRRFYLSDDDKDAICRDFELSPAHFDRVLYRAKQRMRVLIERHQELKSL